MIHHRKYVLRLLCICIVAGLAACKREEPPPAIRVAVAAPRDISVSVTATGAVAPVATVEVKSQASGEIVEVSVDDGDVVTRGQLLALVDPRIPRNAVAQAEADSVVATATLANAESRLRRAELLYEAKAMTEEELEGARLARAQAYASLMRGQRTLEDARIALVQTEVRAPSNGIILARTVEVGSVIASASRDVGGGAVLMRMANLDTVEVQALVAENDVALVRRGAPVTIKVSSNPNRPFEGTVLRIGAEAVVQQNVTSFPVLVRIPNRERVLKPGMNADVEIRVTQERASVAVPNAALRNVDELRAAAEYLGLDEEWIDAQITSDAEETVPVRPDGRGRGGPGRGGRATAGVLGGNYAVLVTRNDTIDVRFVRTGATDFGYSAVLSGLAVGDSVIIVPTAGLLNEQAERQEWIDRRAGANPLGGGAPGGGGRGGPPGRGGGGGGGGGRGGGRN
jgi:HlyD family secretion protein